MKIIIAGDFCPRDRVATMVANEDYSFFDGVKDIIKGADYSIVNFECPVVEGNATPIAKCGPALRTERKAVDAIKYAGFNCVTLANNHFRDFGNEGCKTTIDELNRQNVDFVGGGNNLKKAQEILYKEIEGKRLAVVNFCENEFSIASETQAGAAPLDVVDNYNQIITARKNADYVLVIVHGGHEHYQLPSPRMKKLYRYFIALGADAVVNHHQHCYSGYEYYNGKPIVYGLGNFCFCYDNKYDSIWNEGYCVEIDFESSLPHISLYPYIQCNKSPLVTLMADSQREKFQNRIDELNDIIADDTLLNESFDNWIESRRKSVLHIFASYHNRYLNAAASRGYIPLPISKSEVGAMLNYIACEAHRDITIAVLNDKMCQK